MRRGVLLLACVSCAIAAGIESPPPVRVDAPVDAAAHESSPATAPTTARSDPFAPESILRDVTWLASDAFAGREARSDEARRAADWIAGQFALAGLVPLEGFDGFLHDIGDGYAPNVIGVRPGAGGRLVMITAHYDHLGTVAPDHEDVRAGDRVFNGADDNASGVAGMLAVARAIASEAPGEAGYVFVAFGAEEVGLRGSRQLAGDPPFDLTRVAAMFNMDMISRGEPDLIFVDGSRDADPLRDALRHANERESIGLRIEFDRHPDWLQRSDQGPFIRRRVPAVLLSVEDHDDYHQVTDHADRILPELASRVARLVYHASRDLGR